MIYHILSCCIGHHVLCDVIIMCHYAAIRCKYEMNDDMICGPGMIQLRAVDAALDFETQKSNVVMY